MTTDSDTDSLQDSEDTKPLIKMATDVMEDNSAVKITKDDGEEIEDRGTWTGKFDFLLSALGYAVGLGNLWRFPYLCFKHGGGSFLVPYLIMLFAVGIPLMLLEFTVGQFSALASLPLYKSLCPLFSGIGYSIIISSVLGAALYMVVLAWTIFYFFDSFRSVLRWQHCGYDFNTPNCFSDRDFKTCVEDGGVYVNHTCFAQNSTFNAHLEHTPVGDRVAAAEEYFNYHVVGRTSGIDDFGSFNWRIFLCILTGWVIVFFSCIKGIKSSGKVVYFTATFPYVVLVILLIRGVTLDGAYEGILYYVTPKWDRLGDITIWQEAAVQIFFSLSIGGGGMITLASYNKFNNNIVRDTFIISIGNCLTSVFAGFAIFSAIGFMAKQLGKDIGDVVAGGPGLAFIVYPDAITRIPISPLWAVLFFLMLITLGLDSLFAGIENIVSSVIDEVPRLRKKKILVLFIFCLLGILMALPLSLGSGIYFLDLCFAVLGWKTLVNGILELVIIGHLYGLPRFYRDIKAMCGWTLGTKTGSHLSVLYLTLAPIILTLLVTLTFVNYKPFESAGYMYPLWANVMGWIISFAPIFIIIFCSIKKIYDHRDMPIKKRLKMLITPTDNWYQNSMEVMNVRRGKSQTQEQTSL